MDNRKINKLKYNNNLKKNGNRLNENFINDSKNNKLLICKDELFKKVANKNSKNSKKLVFNDQKEKIHYYESITFDPKIIELNVFIIF